MASSYSGISNSGNGLRPYVIVAIPSPLSPSPYEGEGEYFYKRGVSPLLDTPNSYRANCSLMVCR